MGDLAGTAGYPPGEPRSKGPNKETDVKVSRSGASQACLATLVGPLRPWAKYRWDGERKLGNGHLSR